MVWAKIDDQFTDHEKVVGLSLAAKGLWLCGLVYSARRLTDGFVSEDVVARECYNAESDSLTWTELSNELVNAGLWERAERGFQIHDYLEYNPSKAQVQAERMTLSEKRAAAGKAGAAARWQADGNSHGKPMANGMANGWQTDGPVPVPVPVPTTNEGKGTHRARADGQTLAELNGDTTPILDMFAAYAAGAGIGNGTSEWHTRQLADLPALRTAVHVGLDPGKLDRMTRYVAQTWLAKGITVTPEVAKVLRAESEFDRWETAGCPVASARAPTGHTTERPTHMDRARAFADKARQLEAEGR